MSVPSVEKLLEYGLGTAVVLLALVPLLFRSFRMISEDRKLIVSGYVRLAEIMDNHLSSISKTLAVIEERTRDTDRHANKLDNHLSSIGRVLAVIEDRTRRIDDADRSADESANRKD